MTFSIPGEPRGKARPRFFARKGGGVGKYNDDKTVGYENLVKVCARDLMRDPPTDGPVMVEILAYFAPPKSMKKSLLLRAIDGFLRCMKKPDVDNIAKITCDALNKIVWHDDAQVTDLVVRKRYHRTPRVEVRIRSVEAMI